jgi:hypothetical protein
MTLKEAEAVASNYAASGGWPSKEVAEAHRLAFISRVWKKYSKKDRQRWADVIATIESVNVISNSQ